MTLRTPRGPVTTLRGIDLDLDRGEAIGIAGESGAGKSTLAAALIRLLPVDGDVGGEVILDGVDVLKLGAREMRRIRGRRIGVVFQDPLLDPLMRIGDQVREASAAHGLPHSRAHVAGFLEMVSLDAEVASLHPHQLSGGMRQRAQLAIALAAEPDVLVADEPTTGLDAVLQEELVALLVGLRARLAMSIIFITHDLRLIARLCSRVFVMYDGLMIEDGATAAVLADPRHPYTRFLIEASRWDAGSSLFVSVPGTPDSPTGCSFAPRCSVKTQRCPRESPPVVSGGDWRCRCFLYA